MALLDQTGEELAECFGQIGAHRAGV